MDIKSLLLEAAKEIMAVYKGEKLGGSMPDMAHRLEAAAEKMGEPVAWRVCRERDHTFPKLFHSKACANAEAERVRLEPLATIEPMYAAPPPAVPDYSRVKKALELYESEYVGQKHEPLWSWAWLAAAKEQGHE